MAQCDHRELVLDTPSLKKKGVFQRPTTPERIAASTASVAVKKGTKQVRNCVKLGESHIAAASTFPGPLVLPGDDLYNDPEYPPQSMQEWIDEEDRNGVTKERRTIYLASPPSVPWSMRHVDQWSAPQIENAGQPGVRRRMRPQSSDVLDYLRAFYHPLPVKVLDHPQPQWVEWNEKSHTRRITPNGPRYIGLDIGSEAVRITVRKSPDGVFKGQLNLNDLIDATMAFLPTDAYALLMLLDHDIYEDEDDDFCCGRAYGASRVAVISMARYDPTLDSRQDVEREHAWPASHCKAYVDSRRGTKKRAKKQTALDNTDADNQDAAMRLAVSACLVAQQNLECLWLGRVCKTASHELGHCFGLDHCVYYACIMQSTCGMSEDARQPPYLCAVDLAKVLSATSASETERDRLLLQFCERFESLDVMFAGFAAWLRFRLGGQPQPPA